MQAYRGLRLRDDLRLFKGGKEGFALMRANAITKRTAGE
jgi:hypothetical protein